MRLRFLFNYEIRLVCSLRKCNTCQHERRHVLASAAGQGARGLGGQRTGRGVVQLHGYVVGGDGCVCLLLFVIRSVLILFHQASMIHKRVLQLDSSNIEAIASLGAHQVIKRAAVS